MSLYITSKAPQGTPEWLLARAGKATGSRAKDILAKIKVGEAATRRDYRIQLVTERLTGMPEESSFVSKEMLWGTEQEPVARMAYEWKTGLIVSETGFMYFPALEAGCSIDGHLYDGEKFGIVEFKCPKSTTHIKYTQEKRLPPEHEAQVIHNMWVTNAKFCDFVSFDPRLPKHLQLFIIRVERDEERIKEHEKEVLQFLIEVDELYKQLNKEVA